MAGVRYYIQSADIPRTQVTPTHSGDYEYTREDGAIYYRFGPKDEFIFKGADWVLLEPYLFNTCYEVVLEVERYCSGVYTLYWSGSFIMKANEVDLDRCLLSVTAKPDDAYKCFEEAAKDEVNVYTSGPVTTVAAYGGTIEEEVCTTIDTHGDTATLVAMLTTPDDSCLANPAEWGLKSNLVYLDGNLYTDYFPPEDLSAEGDWILEQVTTWQREVLTTDCTLGVPTPPPFGSGWAVLSEDCAGTGTAVFWRVPPTSNGAALGDYTRGRDFKEVIIAMVDAMGCGLSVKSDFFGLNTVGDAPTNSAYTYASTYLQYLTFHQKSDIKRKNAFSGSSSEAWVLKPADFFKDLELIFNVFPVIIDDTLILEHYSFYTSDVGLDASGAKMVKKLSYSGNEDVRTEMFYWAEENSSSEFKANPIEYNCGEKEEERRVLLFSTDLAYTEDPNNADKITDSGFMLIANAMYESNLIIIDANDPLKWTNLQPELHTYARPFRAGKINGVYQDFISWWPYIRQEPFKINLCCGDTFNPEELVLTGVGGLGPGTVERATYNILTDRLQLEIIY